MGLVMGTSSARRDETTRLGSSESESVRVEHLVDQDVMNDDQLQGQPVEILPGQPLHSRYGWREGVDR